MTDISAITGQSRVSSKLKASLEGIQEKKEIQASPELKEIKQFETDMQHAFSLAQDIKLSLETALRSLSD